MKGVWNKLLRVDLTTMKATDEAVPDKVYEMFLGGAGLGAWVLYKEVPAHVKSMDPENRIIFAGGPFSGIKQSGASKWSVTSRVPAMEFNADSAATASWICELKAAGYDAVVVQGKAEKPVYVVVDDGKVEIRDASHLWGKDTIETDEALKAELGKDFEIATIGPAGERLSKFACIATAQKSFAGRSGLGAVMGSKNLKAIAVRGTKECPVADPERLEEINKEINRRVIEVDKAKPSDHSIRLHGTSFVAEPFWSLGNLPIKNYSLGMFDSGVKNLGSPNHVTKLGAKPWPCKYCTLGCHKLVEIKSGPYAFKGKDAEYESFAMMGFNLMIDDLEAVVYAGYLANRYGLDTISLGAVLAWAFESYEKGVLTKEDTYGIELTWGNGAALVEMTKKIGLREPGLGWLLGEGCKIASEKTGKGSEAWAVQMKGLEIPAHDGRAAYLAALNYCTGTGGPNHERGNAQHIWVGNIRLPEWGITADIKMEERHTWNEAGDRVAKFQDYCNIINSLCHCKFHEFSGYTLTDMLNTLNAVTGWGWNQDDFRRSGQRISVLQRMLNIRYGVTKKDDFTYPERMKQPKPDGPVAGITPAGLEDAIMDYYRVRGYDTEGVPTEATIKELGLDRIP